MSYKGKATLATEMEFERVEATMHKIACALYYRHTGAHLTCPTHTIIRQSVDELGRDNGSEELFSMFADEPLPWHGSNPKVFKYQMVGEFGFPPTFHLVFYEGVNVIVAPEISLE